MRIYEFISIAAMYVWLTTGAFAGDCNENGIPDAQDIQGDVAFPFAQSYVTGAIPNTFDTGDLNADGYPDVVTNSLFDNMIVVLLNNGDGTYAQPVSYPAGIRPVSLAVGDTNRDGFDDVVVADQNGNEILLFESNASGVLALADTLSFNAPVLVLLENLTADANRDLVIVDENGDGEVHLSLAAGVFVFINHISISSRPRGAAIGDFDDNGGNDIVFVVGANQPFFEIAMNNGNGGFIGFGQYILFVNNFTSVAAADLSGDGVPEVILGRSVNDDVIVVSNDGTGTFDLFNVQQIPTGDQPTSLAAVDIDKDGEMDIAVSNQRTQNVEFLINDGGTLTQSGATPPTPRFVSKIVATDVELDTDPDLIALSSEATVTVLENFGAATFAGGPGFVAFPSASPYGLVYEDLNDDGADDLAFTTSQGRLEIHEAVGSGFLPLDSKPVSANALWLESAHLNADAFPDLIVSEARGGRISVFINNGDGTFADGVAYALPTENVGLTTGDVDNDGDTDVVAVSAGPWNQPCNCYPNAGEVNILLNDGTGALSTWQTITIPEGPFDAALGYFDGDNFLDLAVVRNVGMDVQIRLNQGDGTFGAIVEVIPLTTKGFSLTTADLDNDSLADLVVATFDFQLPTLDNALIAFGNGDGSFSGETYYLTSGGGSIDVATVDLDLDGDLDLAFASAILENISVLTNRGDGTFEPTENFLVATGPYRLATGNLNDDAFPDLVLSAPLSNRILLVDNASLAPFSSDENRNGIPDECEFLLGDMNCDGAVTVSDIGWFVTALVDPAGYVMQQPDCELLNADTNNDGAVTVSDIGLFVAAILGG